MVKNTKSAKEAFLMARKYLSGLLERAEDDFTLEEVELTDDKDYWLITVSYITNYILNLKAYKVVKLDADSGEVVAVKIRQI